MGQLPDPPRMVLNLLDLPLMVQLPDPPRMVLNLLDLPLMVQLPALPHMVLQPLVSMDQLLLDPVAMDQPPVDPVIIVHQPVGGPRLRDFRLQLHLLKLRCLLLQAPLPLSRPSLLQQRQENKGVNSSVQLNRRLWSTQPSTRMMVARPS